MPADSLIVTSIQPDIVWEDKSANLEHYTGMIDSIAGPKEIVLLPEMFTTGFSMDAQRLAEDMAGPSVHWMRDMARKHRIILCGSLIIEEGGRYFNRLIWMQPDGAMGTYDKRHLFAYAGEDAAYSAGDRRLIVQVKGWRICPMVCYDLRFPVWARNSIPAGQEGGEGSEGSPAYDVLLYVANWPQRRSLAWKTLLQARAIENQCYSIGVNRTGTDGAGIAYTGESRVIDPLGEVLWQGPDAEATHTATLSRQVLEATRKQLPFLKDADRFLLL